MSGLLEGKTVVVTGAGGGIGEGIALACASAEANVVVAARRRETGDPVAAEIERRGGSALSVRCDVAVRADVDAAVDATIARFGALDCMVHNALAPVGPPGTIEAVSHETWRSMMGTAVRASYLCATAAHPHLVASGGTLILIASAAGVEGSPYLPAYGMVKAALNRLTTALAAELFDHGIAVNSLAPWDNVATPGAARHDLVEGFRLEGPELMAEAALALCSQPPKQLTGRVAYSQPLLAELQRRPAGA